MLHQSYGAESLHCVQTALQPKNYFVRFCFVGVFDRLEGVKALVKHCRGASEAMPHATIYT